MASTSKVDTVSTAKVNAFGLKLFREISAPNVFVSPVCMAAILEMTRRGATEGSIVAKEFENVLGSTDGIRSVVTAGLHVQGPDAKSKAVQLLSANAAWVQGSIRTSYRDEISKELGADVQPLPKEPAPVNNWIKKQTQGAIETLIDTIEPDTVALLVNAIFFKGSWTVPFDPKETKETAWMYEPEKPDGPKVQMMFMSESHFRHARLALPGKVSKDQVVSEIDIVELPYGSGDEYCADIVVPVPGTSLDDVVKASDSWDEWMKSLSDTKKRFQRLGLPRFKIEHGPQSLKASLQAMGIKAAFGGEGQSNLFDKMTSDERVYVSDVVHKVAIEVTEEGTTAASAGAAVMMTRSASPGERLVVDRPFLFAIRQRSSGLVLFMGRVDTPAGITAA